MSEIVDEQLQELEMLFLLAYGEPPVLSDPDLLRTVLSLPTAPPDLPAETYAAP